MSRPLEPRVLPQRRRRTVLVRCPSSRWNQVSTGQITEFRAHTGNVPQVWDVRLPTLAVIYRRRLSQLEYDYRLMMLEGVRREALGAITDAGLDAAGYRGEDAFARFRRDWVLYEKRRFEPLITVAVFTVHPVGEGDRERAGLSLLDALYGDFEDAVQTSRTVATVRDTEPQARHYRQPPRPRQRRTLR